MYVNGLCFQWYLISAYDVPWSTGALKSGWWSAIASFEPSCLIIAESPGCAAGDVEESDFGGGCTERSSLCVRSLEAKRAYLLWRGMTWLRDSLKGWTSLLAYWWRYKDMAHATNWDHTLTDEQPTCVSTGTWGSWIGRTIWLSKPWRFHQTESHFNSSTIKEQLTDAESIS